MTNVDQNRIEQATSVNELLQIRAELKQRAEQEKASAQAPTQVKEEPTMQFEVAELEKAMESATSVNELMKLKQIALAQKNAENGTDEAEEPEEKVKKLGKYQDGRSL